MEAVFVDVVAACWFGEVVEEVFDGVAFDVEGDLVVFVGAGSAEPSVF